ncbi:MAG: phosphodiester glycosidase family protein [Candidatus Binatia bacterium]
MSRNISAKSLAPFALLVIAVAVFAQSSGKAKLGANLTVTEAGTWTALQRGVEFRKMTVERSEPASTVELEFLRIDSKAVAARVLTASQFKLKAASAKTFAERSGALAVVNANYFDENGRPLAYLKNSEKEINRSVSKHALYTGIFGISAAAPFVVHRDDFQPTQASEALQTGPLLLNRGAAVEGLSGAGRYARRSVIGIDKESRVIVAVADAVIGGLSFGELQELFRNAKWHVNAVDLLNLDGGGSAQLYVKTGKFEEWLPGTAEVPVAIGFFVKTN